MTLLRLVRHGETDWNLAGRIQGQTDIPLNDTGRAQAVAAADQLAGIAYDRVISSTLGRAIETGRIIAAGLSATGSELRQETDEALCEQAWGEAEGCPWSAVDARFPDGIVPGRESHVRFVDRAAGALQQIARECDGRESAVIVVTHGGVIDALCRFLSGTDGVPFVKSENGSITDIRISTDGRMARA